MESLIADAVAWARRLWPGRMVEVECDRIDQVDEAVRAGATVVMLDNMTPERWLTPWRGCGAAGNGSLVEVSGRLSRRQPRAAAAGADLISVGALTHSAPVLDLGFDLLPVPAAKAEG